MILLDENAREDQSLSLTRSRIHVHQIGRDIGHSGMQDEEIISLLHQLNRPTLFTLDADFYVRRWCHRAYCLVHLEVDDKSLAKYVRRVLRHREFNSRAKRMGSVIQVRPAGISLWRINRQTLVHLEWT